MKVHLLVDAQCRLGDCAVWCDRTAALSWTDIEGSTISRWSDADANVRQRTLPGRVGSFALCERPEQLLLGLASGTALFNLATGAMSPIDPVEPRHPGTRIDDGRCDAQGRFVFGMFNGARGAPPISCFYRVTEEMQVEQLPLPRAGVANSIAFSPDGTLMYFTHTWPTCPSFGWAALDRIFVMSARIGLDGAALRAQPAAGGMFIWSGPRRGMPEHRFATDLLS